MGFTRIIADPDQIGGVPCMRGLSIHMRYGCRNGGRGMTNNEILKAFPDLEPGDMREALRYAAEALRERDLPLLATA